MIKDTANTITVKEKRLVRMFEFDIIKRLKIVCLEILITLNIRLGVSSVSQDKHVGRTNS